MSKKVKEVILLLEINGWHHSRTRGSHKIFTKPGAPRSIPIAGKESDDMAEGTYRRILREAGLD
ncbi:MAG: type II toxin-antitoxin system HicA family toxin [Bacteroidales bacterium]|nr:type II toxin-antitoxin system HicA family toxin [Bacteroidales bacterium]